MRTIPAGLLAHLQEETLTICLLIKIVRKDGISLGFTTSDINLTYDGLQYETVSGVSVSALQQTVGSGIDNMDVLGALISEAITDFDLRAGRYDGATFTVMLANYNAIEDGVTVLLKGWVGQISIQDGTYTAEVRSLVQQLAQSVGDLTTQTCRAKRLGDWQCRYREGLGGPERFTETVTQVISTSRVKFAGDSHASGYYTYGIVKLTTGSNAGIEREIKLHVNSGGAVIDLQEPFPFPVLVGDVAELEIGCNRTLDRCRELNNTINFQGEPFLPGNSKIMEQGRGT